MIRKVKTKDIRTITICPTLSFFSFMLMFGYGREKILPSPPFVFLLSQIKSRINCALYALIHILLFINFNILLIVEISFIYLVNDCNAIFLGLYENHSLQYTYKSITIHV